MAFPGQNRPVFSDPGPRKGAPASQEVEDWDTGRGMGDEDVDDGRGRIQRSAQNIPNPYIKDMQRQGAGAQQGRSPLPPPKSGSPHRRQRRVREEEEEEEEDFEEVEEEEEDFEEEEEEEDYEPEPPPKRKKSHAKPKPKPKPKPPSRPNYYPPPQPPQRPLPPGLDPEYRRQEEEKRKKGSGIRAKLAVIPRALQVVVAIIGFGLGVMAVYYPLPSSMAPDVTNILITCLFLVLIFTGLRGDK